MTAPPGQLRPVDPPERHSSGRPSAAAAPGTPLTVLAFNTFEGDADPAALAALIAEHRPDLVAIPEAGERYRARLAPLVEPLGYRAEAVGPREDVDGVAALVSHRLGDVSFRAGDDPAYFPYLEVTGGGLGELRFVAFHAAAPLQIDHVLTAGGIAAETSTVHDVAGSDHRAVLTRLRLPG